VTEDADLERLVEAISDGSRVDWSREHLLRPDLRSLLDQLQGIEAVAAAHGTLPDRATAPAAETAPATEARSAAAEVHALPKRIGHYAIEGVLGSGGMGIVYLAHDTRLDRYVAIKALPDALAGDSQGMSRFRREAKLLASLVHPHIATVYGLETARGCPHLVMERVEGRTLAAHLRQGPLTLEDALRICAQVAQAIEAAHDRGVIHRDLKPGNVMVGQRGTAKVLDFGLAKRVKETPPPGVLRDIASTFMTDTIVRVGTPGYMSPEQIVGAAQDARTDVFAFGCLLYECLTSRRAFSGDSAVELLTAALATEPDWTVLPASTPRAVRTLLKR